MIDRAIPDMLCWFVPAVFSHPRALNLSFLGEASFSFLMYRWLTSDRHFPILFYESRVCAGAALKSAFFGDPKDAKLKTTKGSTAADRLP